MKSLEGLRSGLEKKQTHEMIARKLYLSYATEIFRDDEDREFDIKNDISVRFNIPFSSIQVAGSSKTGISFFKDKKFEPKQSDLDISIVNLNLFNIFVEEAHRLSRGYSDLTIFPRRQGVNYYEIFRKGIFYNGFANPYYFPNSNFKDEWFSFFRKLSSKHLDLFKNINAGVYASEYFFEKKQASCIDQYLLNPEKYDKISSSIS